jgi:hypothetical protein
MGSRAFKDELERIVEDQIKNGGAPASLLALQQLCESSNKFGTSRSELFVTHQFEK